MVVFGSGDGGGALGVLGATMDNQGSFMGNRSWGQVGSHTGDVWGNLCGLVCSVPLQFFAKLWKIICMHSLFGAWRFAIFPENNE